MPVFQKCTSHGWCPQEVPRPENKQHPRPQSRESCAVVTGTTLWETGGAGGAAAQEERGWGSGQEAGELANQRSVTVPGRQELQQKLLEVYFLLLFALGVPDAGRPPLRCLPILFRNFLPLHSLLGFISCRQVAFTKSASCRHTGQRTDCTQARVPLSASARLLHLYRLQHPSHVPSLPEQHPEQGYFQSHTLLKAAEPTAGLQTALRGYRTAGSQAKRSPPPPSPQWLQGPLWPRG